MPAEPCNELQTQAPARAYSADRRVTSRPAGSHRHDRTIHDRVIHDRSNHDRPTMGRHDEWASEEGWRERLRSLEERICELLIANQRLRMSLESAMTPAQGEQDAGNVEGI